VEPRKQQTAMVQAAPAWRSAGRTFLISQDKCRPPPATAWRRIPRLCERYRASRSQPAQPEQDEPAQHHQAQGQQAKQKDVAAECSHRDISHAGGSEVGKVGNRTLPFGAKRQQSPQNTASVLRTRRRRFAVTASRASGSGNVVSKISQARGMAVEAQDRDHSRHHPPYPFFSEMRRNGRARRRRIVGRRSAHFENERSRILASPNESRCAGARRWRSALPKSS
jgi:hypothetical protein